MSINFGTQYLIQSVNRIKYCVPRILILASFMCAPISNALAAGQKPQAQKPAPQSQSLETVCPKCHNNESVVPIVYGYPDDSLLKDQEEGKVALGGCVITGNDPQWFCKSCKKSW